LEVGVLLVKMPVLNHVCEPTQENRPQNNSINFNKSIKPEDTNKKAYNMALLAAKTHQNSPQAMNFLGRWPIVESWLV